MEAHVKGRVLVSVLAGLSLATGASAATLCVNPGGTGACHALIQSAVNAAAAGDRIVVYPGAYYENVVVPVSKAGVQILGANKLTTILDPDAPNSGVGLLIEAQKVQVANLTIRNGRSDGIVVTGSGTVIRGVNVTGTNLFGINLAGAWNAQVLSSEVHAVQVGIYASGFGAIIKNNTVTQATSGAINVTGDAIQIVGNRISTSATGITATADGMVVDSNEVRYQTGFGIFVSGRYPTVQRNRVFGTGTYGILTTCTDCFGGLVASNSITDTTSYGLYVNSDAPGLVVRGNVLLRTGGGITLNGTGITAQANRVSDPGVSITAHCFEVYGELNTLTGNTALACAAAGFYVNGQGNTLERNVATNTQENGFTVDGDSGGTPFADNVLTANQTATDAAQGFAILNAAANTVLTANRAARNRVDFCDEGAGTVLSGNLFGTASATCPISH